METDTQHEEIIEQLKILNKAVRKQNAVSHILMTGVLYGLGAFLGSAVIATILFGLLAPYVGHITWVRESYERGSTAPH